MSRVYTCPTFFKYQIAESDNTVYARFNVNGKADFTWRSKRFVFFLKNADNCGRYYQDDKQSKIFKCHAYSLIKQPFLNIQHGTTG